MLEDTIAVARGERPADLVLRGGQIVNTLAGEVVPADVAIYQGRVAGLTTRGEVYEAQSVVDLDGAYVCPGFIDAHVHLESSMVHPAEFARAVVPRGTTAVVADPHEIANVFGLYGIRYMMDSSEGLPLDVYIMASSCVPATHMETAGAALSANDLALLLHDPRVLGIAEMMNYPGVLFRDPDVMRKIVIAGNRPIDGHAPMLSGKDLNAYVVAGIGSDHECTNVEEAREKLRLGMRILIREGTTARDLESLLPLVTPLNARRCAFCNDDRHPADLLNEGHIDFIVRKAIRLGCPPITAIQMATINPAEYFGLHHHGAVAPDFVGDLMVFDDLQAPRARQVYKAGRLVAENGVLLPNAMSEARRIPIRSSMNVDWMGIDFKVPALGDTIKVIGVIPDQIVTRKLVEPARIEGGLAVADVDRDILKMAVVERHMALGNIGLGFVQGVGLKRGAMASSVAHDSHNIVIIGTNDEDMMTACIEVVRMRGGQAVVADGEVLARLALPIAGLMSEEPLEKVREGNEALARAAADLGCHLRDPMMAMAFLSLPVIPVLKLTDKGLVDVAKFDFVSLFGEE
ncbi:MAG: adenine deaminase [Chloroflexi bacterium]|nr:adenine deaminase [Chloroflexota bacterium]